MATNSPGPGRRAVRYILELVGLILLRILSRTTIHDAGRVPRHGPFIIAGNHRAVMEIFLMLAITRPHVELIGSGDFPLDPRFRFLALWYGYIPYRRGSVDGKALRRALRALAAGGVVGIFPEGGIWTDGPKETQRGVAWLAAQSGAPVLPVGFAGIDRGVERLMALQFPVFEVRVGTLERFTADEITRSTLDAFSTRVMDQIDALIPEWDRQEHPVPAREEYRLELRTWAAAPGPERSSHAPVPQATATTVRTDPNAVILARFYHIPTLLSIFRVNLLRDVEAMKSWDRRVPAPDLARACRRILGYLALRNPYLFTYRLGQEQGTRLREAIAELRDWADSQGDALVSVVPVREVTWPDGREEVHRAPAG